MLSSTLFLFAVGPQALRLAPQEPLPQNHRLVAQVRQRGSDLFAYIPEGHSLRQLPNTINELESWAQVDHRWRAGSKEYLVRSAQDMFPRDLLSLQSRRYGVLRNARNLLLNMSKGSDATHFSVATRVGETPLSTRKAIVGGVFTGYDEIPANAVELGCSLVIAPGYVFTDRQTGQQKSFALDRLPWTQKPTVTDLPTFPASTELEELRTRTLAPAMSDLTAEQIEIQPGVYKLKSLFDRATQSKADKFRLDKRFHDLRLLVATSKPISSTDLLASIARTFDLYPRSLAGGWFFAVSPGDPYEFYLLKQKVEERAFVLGILKRLYATGRVPAYIAPELFCTPDQDLPMNLKERLVADLSRGFSQSFLNDKENLSKSMGDMNRWKVTCYLSVCISLHSDMQNTNGCATYP